MRTLTFTAVLFGLWIAGCGETREVVSTYDAETNQTTYETKSYTVSGTELGSGLTDSGAKSITLQAIARCEGAGCTPQDVRLAFSTKGNARLNVTGAGGELVADGRRIAWTSDEAGGQPSRGGGRVYEVQGIFATVDISLPELEQIAAASRVEGAVGGKALDFDKDVQLGFQKLLQEIRGDQPQ